MYLNKHYYENEENLWFSHFRFDDAVMRQSAESRWLCVKGNIEGLPDGTHVQLVPVSHDSELPFADTTVVNGQFVFTGKMEEPRAFHLLVKDAYGSRNLMLENAQMEVTGKLVAKKESDGGVSYNLSSLSVKGSPLSARYDSLLSARTYLDSLYAFNARKFAAFDSLMMAAYKSRIRRKLRNFGRVRMVKPGQLPIRYFLLR